MFPEEHFIGILEKKINPQLQNIVYYSSNTSEMPKFFFKILTFINL